MLLQVVPPSSTPTWAADTIVPLELRQYADHGQTDQAALAEARHYVNMLADRFETRGITVDGMAMLGEPASTITEAAADLRTDLTVMRTRGYTGATRAVLGSVADAVVRARVPGQCHLRAGRGARRVG